MGLASRGKWLTSLGVALIALGVCGSYVLQRAGTEARESVLFQAVELTSFPLVLLGLFVVLVACCILAAELATNLTMRIGLCFLLMAGITIVLGRLDMMPINVNDWTASLVPPLLALLPLGLLFVGTSIVRVSRSKDKMLS